MINEQPRVFITYSWEEDSHKKWVRDFTDQLINDGIDAYLDQYDLTLGDRLPQFMEQSISNADYVLVICTPIYKQKSDNRVGGVGYEGHIISAELLSTRNEHKFIPVIRKGTVENSLPLCLSGKLGVDLSREDSYKFNYQDLITTLYGKKSNKPVLGKIPGYIAQIDDNNSIMPKTEEINIMGIVTDKVTVPKMDGTRGSALYKIPFKLSKQPSSLWKKIFLETWKYPPRFSTMHRPGIASIYGDEIILDGTTIEEVRDYHRETLILCVQEANKKEADILNRQRLAKEAEERKKQQHYSNVNDIANEIEF